MAALLNWRLAMVALALAWMALISYASAQATLPGDQEIALGIRKLGHVGVFGILALLIRWSFGPRLGLLPGTLAALILAALFATSDEVHQAFVEGRHGTVTDVMIDVAGASTALAAWWLAKRAGAVGAVVHQIRRG